MTKPPLIFLKIFLSFLLTSQAILVISQSSNSEQAILLSIKKQWNNQTPLQLWNLNTSPCHWPGIQCSDVGTVTGISLNSQNIYGKILPSICDLKYLTTLDLGNNYISGGFPTVLYNCTNLQSLNLSSNLLVGQLPNDINKLSPRLRFLDLSYNNLTGDIPSSIGQLKGLISLNLVENQFNGTFPSELGNLENLEELFLAYNQYSPMELPTEFGLLNSLKFLWMTQCNLIGKIPETLADLSNLEQLDLAKNNLVGQIPSRLFLLKNLTYIYLYQNNLTGGFPRLMQALNLKKIDVATNSLTGTIPQGIGNLPSLEVLNLYENQFYGTIPASIGLIPALTVLKLFNNRFSGPLPPELGLHSKLEYFEVPDNGFTGQLPEHLCSGKTLFGLVAFNNHLNGSIPISLGQCNSLVTIMLYNNSMSGEVPEGLWTLKNIVQLLLEDNQFFGQFPKKLAENVTHVKINNNKISGNIPPSVGTWRNLQVLEASNNLLSGTVPMELTNLTHLSTLSVNGNKLSGELPSKIISWKSLNSLNVARNELSGPIPPALGSLPALKYLDFSDNQFTGQIPLALGKLQLSFLNLSSNKLTGEIPHGFENNAYETSFLNTRLCSNGGILNQPRCSIHQKFSKNLSSKYLALILAIALVTFLATLCITWFMIWQRMYSQDIETWILTSFHKAGFREENILSNLTNGNLIGRGGSGEVYRVPINWSGEVVAVKKILENKKIHNTQEKQFLAEVQILGTIKHVNIVKLLCCISSEHSKFLVYEYMENQSLDKWIHERKTRPVLSKSGSVHHVILDWPQRLKIAVGAAKGLCYMHHDCSPPIIHRDIKSSNILLDLEFNAKIADFGLSRILAKPGQPQTVTTVAGSYGYMAPEYVYTSKADEKIDIYSFGVVLLELVTGKEPHRGDEYSNLAEWAWRHYIKGHPIVDALDEEVKEACFLEEMTIVFKIGLMCTSTLPSSRPSMKGVLQVLRQKCSSLESFGGANARGEHDFAPLIGSENYISSCKNSRRAVDEDDYSRDWICNHSL